MKNSFEEISKSTSDQLKEIEKIITEFSSKKSPLISEITNHIISSGGKRIRPILLILSSELCRVETNQEKNDLIVNSLSAAIELIHTATLLHDDVVDASQIRRGKKTANSLWDNKPSILVGDYLFSVAFQLMVRSNNIKILDILAKSSSIMANGEILQLENINNINLSEEDYIKIIFGKTAVLFSAACEAGSMVFSNQAEKIESLREFGKNIGIIFQIIDDILDYSSNKNTLGKNIGEDFFEGKVTMPIIILNQLSSDLEKKFLKETFEKNFLNKDKNQNDFQKVISLFEKYKIIQKSKDKLLQYHDLAVKNLEIFSNSTAKEKLISTLEYSMSRIY